MKMFVVVDNDFNRANYPSMIGKRFSAAYVPGYVNLQETDMIREDAEKFVRYVVDDAGAARPINTDQHAVIRHAGDVYKHSSRLIGWNRNDPDSSDLSLDPTFVAVHSYLDVEINNLVAVDMAIEYLYEIDFFKDGETTSPDYVF